MQHEYPPASSSDMWIFVAWIDTDDGAKLAYGCSAGTRRSPGWRETATVSLPSGRQLQIREQVLVQSDLDELWTMPNGKFDLTAVDLDAPICAIAFVRNSIGTGFGHSAATVTSYYPEVDVAALGGHNATDWAAVIDELESRLNLPFSDAYARRLGAFDRFRLHPWLEDEPPFDVRVCGAEEPNGPGLLFIRTPEFAKVLHTAQASCRRNGELTDDALIHLPPGIQRQVLSTSHQPHGFDVRLYAEDGRLIHAEQANLIVQFATSMGVVRRELRVEDDLSRRARAQGGQHARGADSVSQHETHNSIVSFDDSPAMRARVDALVPLVADHVARSTNDHWFSKSVDDEVGVIAYFNRLLDAGQTHSAILVDPFFGEDALTRLALRLGSMDVELTVITSWGRVQPDSGMAFDNDYGLASVKAAGRLGCALRNIEPLIGPKLRVLNLVTGTGKQAFHDRYLLIRGTARPTQVFLLSNSVNKMAGNWPFCMSQLTGKAKLEATRYIDGLARGEDVSCNQSPKVTFRWPTNAGA